MFSAGDALDPSAIVEGTDSKRKPDKTAPPPPGVGPGAVGSIKAPGGADLAAPPGGTGGFIPLELSCATIEKTKPTALEKGTPWSDNNVISPGRNGGGSGSSSSSGSISEGDREGTAGNELAGTGKDSSNANTNAFNDCKK